MDPITAKLMSAAGAAAGDSVYVDDLFSTFLYNGNATNATAINNGIDLSGEGGLTWIKGRTYLAGSSAFSGAAAQQNILFDTERGSGYPLSSNLSDPESNFGSAASGGQTFTSTGFQIGYNGYNDINYNGTKYCSWSFRKCPGFFDVVTYTGDGNTSKTISHSLGSTPGFIIIKRLDNYGNWRCYHRSLTNTDYWIQLDSTSAEQSLGVQNWAVSSTDFTVYGAATDTNISGGTYVAYVFAHDDQSFGTNGNESIIKCGGYTGNGSTPNATAEQSGPDIDLGFEPQYLLVKKISGSDPWFVFDTVRGFPANFNGPTQFTYADANSNESDLNTYAYLRLTNQGFKITAGTGAYFNDNGAEYIYMAIRRPHKPPTAATEVFDLRQSTSDTSGFQTSTSVFTDMVVNFNNPASGVISKYWVPRTTTAYYLPTYAGGESSHGNTFKMDQNTGFTRDNWWGGTTAIDYSFRRAPGFFDVVNYLGTGSAQTLNHNLGAVPELMIVKSRTSGGWVVYSAATGNTKSTFLSSDDAFGNSPTDWNNTTPTATQLTIGSNLSTSGHYFIGFLFATLDGISKVGSYSGTGYDIDVDCGFTAGARFVLVKRTDSTADWLYFDTLRGIVSGNESAFPMNDNTGSNGIFNVDYIDPLSTGFRITSSAPASLNVSGGSYIFLAIA